ncbi:MAG: AraC family transcriptional regulator [Sulfurimonas sp.]|nr:MAG: AraC family transcriptional regulator [Sulfurimonas sp.]
MVYDIFSSSKELQGIVKQYVVINSLEGIDNLLFLPDGCNFIIFNRGIEGYAKAYKEDRKILIPNNYSVSIKFNKVKKIVLNEKQDLKKISFPIILVELTPIGFFKLFNKDASILSKSYLELEDLIVKKYFNDLYTHSSVEKELQYLDYSLNELYNSHNSVYIPIQDVLDKIENFYYFEVTVNSLIKEFGYSRSTMERQFKKNIGLTPKKFIFLSKFCKTVLVYIEEECTFNELKYLYSDHSYMNAVFKKILGVSPSVILNEVASNKIRIYQMKKVN